MNAFKTNRTFSMNKNLINPITCRTGVIFPLLGRFAIPIDNVVQSLMGNNTSDVKNNIIFNLRLPRILAPF
ncbi:Uncharacterised protein [uncultured Aggregatibacter sp.]|nr:Uncharacterised protein [uncultured Aggregatibacter sp.]